MMQRWLPYTIFVVSLSACSIWLIRNHLRADSEELKEMPLTFFKNLLPTQEGIAKPHIMLDFENVQLSIQSLHKMQETHGKEFLKGHQMRK